MENLNHFAPAIQAVGAVAIIILTAALVCLTRRYVEVSEALQKPCITVMSEPRDPMRAVMGAPFVAQVKRARSVEILNVGTGPALGVSYRFREPAAGGQGTARDAVGFVNHLQPGQLWATQLAADSLPNRRYEFHATCESLSGKRYETTVRIEDAAIKSFVFRRSGKAGG